MLIRHFSQHRPHPQPLTHFLPKKHFFSPHLHHSASIWHHAHIPNNIEYFCALHFFEFFHCYQLLLCTQFPCKAPHPLISVTVPPEVQHIGQMLGRAPEHLHYLLALFSCRVNSSGLTHTLSSFFLIFET